MSAVSLEQRLAGSLPAGTVELETLCRLAGVVETDEVATAAVECVARPRLLINPAFVEEHCERDEHLFLLVMHEIWHVVLAHTRLFPRPTPAHNVAFDAVINATLARQYPGAAYRGFFERINPGDAFPGCLLRPPEGWPRAPVYPGCGPKGTPGLLRHLYPGLPAEVPETVFGDPWRMQALQIPTVPGFEEILALLRAGSWRRLGRRDGGADDVVLLGDHDDPAGQERLLEDPLIGEIVRRTTGGWDGGVTGGSPGLGEALASARRGTADPGAAVRAAFARVLRNALGPAGAFGHRRVRIPEVTPFGLGVLPNPFDRSRHARERLGVAGLLWNQHGPVSQLRHELEPPAHVYLDVSGSMGSLLPRLLGLLVPYVQSGRAEVFQFSTRVEPLPLARLRGGELTTTYGTGIACVLEHAFADPRLRRAVILTDGYTGAAADGHRARLDERRLALHVVLPAECSFRDHLQPIARTITVLPPLGEE